MTEPSPESPTPVPKPAPKPAPKETDAQLAVRVLRLEELVSHQQHLLEQLDQVAANLQRQLDKQRQANQLELDRIRHQITNQTSESLPHEKPPHY